MIRLLITALAVLACGAAAAFYLRSETGYVLISFHHWIVETSLLGLIVAIVAMLFGAYALLRLLVAGVRLPATMQRLLARRRAEKAQESFETGLQIGRASCRARVCQYVEISVVAVLLKKKI